MGDKTHIDSSGYLRFNGSDKLVHRWVAHKYIYLKNREEYSLPFGKYQVHHIDGNKLNNDVSNLQIVTHDEHVDIHIREGLKTSLDNDSASVFIAQNQSYETRGIMSLIIVILAVIFFFINIAIAIALILLEAYFISIWSDTPPIKEKFK